ncbi:MAG: CvpA family protein [Sulfurovum sp.]|nr:CvpA family protein [Sulfurovum sp.]
MENFSMPGFNYFDVTIGAIILLLAIKGFMNGVIKEVFGLAGLVGGVYFASRLAGDAATFIDKNFIHIENAALLKLIGFMSILIIIWLSATILGSIFSKLTSASGLGFMDRLLGFVAGGGKYFVIFALIVTALSNVTLIKENTQKYVKDSMLYPLLYKAGSAIIHINPASLGFNSTAVQSTETTDSNNSTGQ